MDDTVEAWLVIVSVAMVMGVVVAAIQTRHAWRRWGIVERPGPTSGDGAYRATRGTVAVLRGAPPLLVAAAIAATLWGVITLLVFVPAGALFTMVSADGAMLAGGAAVFGLLAALSGLALSFVLPRAGSRLLRRKEGSIEEAGWAWRFSALHHLGVWVGFTLFGMALEPHGEVWAVALAVPCGAGLATSWLLRLARDAARRIEVTSAEHA